MQQTLHSFGVLCVGVVSLLRVSHLMLARIHRQVASSAKVPCGCHCFGVARKLAFLPLTNDFIGPRVASLIITYEMRGDVDLN